MVAAQAKFTDAHEQAIAGRAANFKASVAKDQELHGESAQRYGVAEKKRDGILQASNADWKNPHLDSSNLASPSKGKN